MGGDGSPLGSGGVQLAPGSAGPEARPLWGSVSPSLLSLVCRPCPWLQAGLLQAGAPGSRPSCGRAWAARAQATVVARRAARSRLLA